MLDSEDEAMLDSEDAASAAASADAATAMLLLLLLLLLLPLPFRASVGRSLRQSMLDSVANRSTTRFAYRG